MRIRIAVAADAAALAEVAAATFPLACPPTTTPAAIAAFVATALSPAAFTRHLADPDRVLLVAEPDAADSDAAEPDGAGFAGYAMLVLGEPADADVLAAISIRPTSELSKIYVRRTGHGRGVAAALLERAVAAAGDRGAAGMWLGTNQENGRAQAFYAKHGFARVGTKRFRLGDQDEHDFVYERPLRGGRPG